MIKKSDSIVFAILLLFLFFLSPGFGFQDAGEEKVELKLKLPKPMFVGTPRNIRSPNLERITGKSRPPFYVPQGTELLSFHKPVTASDTEPVIGGILCGTGSERSVGADRPRQTLLSECCSHLALPQPGPGLPGRDRPGHRRP